MPSSVTITWPGKPDLAAPPPPRDGPPLDVRERWPAGGVSGTAAGSAGATLMAGRAEDALDRWRAGDPALAALGRPRLVYLDPPFATGETFAARLPVGPRRPGAPTLRLPAYRDAWPDGLAGYLTMMAGLLTRVREMVADDGWVCLHVDHRASAHLRLLADEVFGPGAFRNEIAWHYGLGNSQARHGFPRKHDTLLLYARSAQSPFHPVRGDVTPAMAAKYRHVRPDGTRFMRSYGREYDLRGGRPVGSVWDIPSVAPTAGDRTGFPTQKPVALLERLVLATTRPGDLVLDPCCGSGTTLVAATGLGRPAAGIDASPVAMATARRRLAGAGVALVVTGPSRDQPTERAGVPRDAHPGHPAARFAVDATAVAGPDGVTVTLTGLTATPAAPHPTRGYRVAAGRLVRPSRDGDPSALTTDWMDWLEGWAVVSGDGVTVRAAAVRDPRRRELALTLAVPCPDGARPDRVVVRLDDVFGGRSDHSVPVVER